MAVNEIHEIVMVSNPGLDKLRKQSFRSPTGRTVLLWCNPLCVRA